MLACPSASMEREWRRCVPIACGVALPASWEKTPERVGVGLEWELLALPAATRAHDSRLYIASERDGGEA